MPESLPQISNQLKLLKIADNKKSRVNVVILQNVYIIRRKSQYCVDVFNYPFVSAYGGQASEGVNKWII